MAWTLSSKPLNPKLAAIRMTADKDKEEGEGKKKEEEQRQEAQPKEAEGKTEKPLGSVPAKLRAAQRHPRKRDRSRRRCRTCKIKRLAAWLSSYFRSIGSRLESVTTAAPL